MDDVILGIHSQVDPRTQGSFDQFIDGHAWISVTRNGQTSYYGLWPDNHPRGLDNGAGTDIRVGIEGEPGFSPTASRYYALDPQQVAELDRALRENVTWSYTNTCASWAAETVARVTGRHLDATDLPGIETPNELVRSLRALEQQRDTSPENPVRVQPPAPSSSFGALDPRDSVHPDHALYQQAWGAVQRLDARLGRAPDEASERMAASLTLLVKRDPQMHRIDEVVLSVQTDKLPAAHNVFAVQGDLERPSCDRVFTQTQVAATTPLQVTFRQLEAFNRAAAPEVPQVAMGIEPTLAGRTPSV